MEEKTENESKKTCLPVSERTRNLFAGYEWFIRGISSFIEPVQDAEYGQGYKHALWMCLNYPKDDEVRANRWLGWLQCILCGPGVTAYSPTLFRLDDVRNHTRNGKVAELR